MTSDTLVLTHLLPTCFTYLLTCVQLAYLLILTFEGFDWVTGTTLEMLEQNATAYLPSLWQARYLGYHGPMRPEWGHPRSCEDAAEEGIFGLEPFGGEHDLPTSWG